MMNDPYANAGGADAGLYAEPERTSVLAIFSLVCSLIGLVICCIPGPEILGALLGLISLILIAGSGGRVGGKGLAIAGLIIGGLMTAVKIGFFFVASAGIGVMTQSADTTMKNLEAGDFGAVRSVLVSPAADVSDDELALFVQIYQHHYGSYQSAPKGMIDFIMSFTDPQIGPHMQGRSGGGNGMVPVPITFDNGKTLLMLYYDPQVGPDAITDLIIVLPDGSELELSDPEDAAGTMAP